MFSFQGALSPGATVGDYTVMKPSSKEGFRCAGLEALRRGETGNLWFVVEIHLKFANKEEVPWKLVDE